MQLLQTLLVPATGGGVKTTTFTVPAGKFAKITPLDDAALSIDAVEIQPDILDADTGASSISATTTIYTNSSSLYTARVQVGLAPNTNQNWGTSGHYKLQLDSHGMLSDPERSDGPPSAGKFEILAPPGAVVRIEEDGVEDATYSVIARFEHPNFQKPFAAPAGAVVAGGRFLVELFNDPTNN